MKKSQVLMLCVAVLLLSVVGAQAKQVVTFSGVYASGEAAVDVQNKFKELLEERSNGEFEVRVIIGSAMGGERDHFEAASQGALEIIAMGSGDVALFENQLSYNEIPFVIRDQDHFFAFWEAVGAEINEEIRKKYGVRTLGVMYRGPRYLTSNRPVYSLADMKGLRLRLPENQCQIRIFQGLGASPIPIAFHEVYSALQTGIAEAQENPIMSIYGYKFHEVQKYLVATKHIFSTAKFQASETWFSSLSPGEQELVQQCMNDAVEYGNTLVMDREKELMEEIMASGMIYIEPPELELESIREAALAIVGQMVEEGHFRKDMYEKVLGL
ncbi:MAG: TRAP transporter substrate-binding protein [Firmicutes bacterium]|nr:TRAP transporter substrate-binding protein [Bacillota bacterium]